MNSEIGTTVASITVIPKDIRMAMITKGDLTSTLLKELKRQAMAVIFLGDFSGKKQSIYPKTMIMAKMMTTRMMMTTNCDVYRSLYVKVQ